MGPPAVMSKIYHYAPSNAATLILRDASQSSSGILERAMNVSFSMA
jgi:hypothetical protein